MSNRTVSVGAFRVELSPDNAMNVTNFEVPDDVDGPALVVIPTDGVPTLFAVFIQQGDSEEEREPFGGLLHGRNKQGD